MGSTPTGISETELEVLKVLWEHGSATVRDIHDDLGADRQWAYTTVLTLLQRLQKKGYVATRKRGIAHVYRPVVSRDKLLEQHLSDLSEQLCEGTSSPLVQALVRGRRFSKNEIAEFRALLDDLEGQSRKRGRGRGGRSGGS